MKNVFYIYYRDIYKTYTFCMGTIGFHIPKNMGIDIKIVTLALLEAKLWPNMWFQWRPFWMCYKTRLRGGKNWTLIFLAYLTPNEAIKTIKSILATEMAKMTYRTRLNSFPRKSCFYVPIKMVRIDHSRDWYSDSFYVRYLHFLPTANSQNKINWSFQEYARRSHLPMWIFAYN